jgi:uncharacterized repeat protein (TIGR03803 family)
VNRTIASLFLAGSLLAGASAGASPTLSELFGFPGADGQDPDYLIQASDGNLYGTTYLGGGTVFEITPAGRFTLLLKAPYDPNGTNHYPDGEFYTSVAEGPDGNLYVVASSGGQSSFVAQPGSLLRISKSGTGFEVVHTFCSAANCTDGAKPSSLVLASDGNFYGSAVQGGSFTCYLGCGVIFRLSTNGTYTVLYSPVNGQTTVGALNPAADGNFYAICSPPISGPPSVCRVTTSGQVTPIFQFPQPLWPANGALTQGSNGLLYGTALINPNSNSFQTVFQLDTSGGSFKQLFQTAIQCCVKIGHSYVIMASDGNLWVTNPNAQLAGSVYSITPTGTVLQTIAFPFQGATGSFPHFLMQASSGILYGATYEYGRTASGGGAYGTIFSINAGLPPK